MSRGDMPINIGRAPFLLISALPWDKDVEQIGMLQLIDTAAIRSIGPSGIHTVIGLHAGGIIFTSYTVAELTAMLAAHGIVIIDAEQHR